MITANTRYTAEEIITEAGIALIDEIGKPIFGSYRILIGGLPVSAPEHVIRIPTETTSLEVVVGVESTTIKVKANNKEHKLSEGAAAVKEAKASGEEE